MAFYGTFGENNLAALSASISQTAYDVFVYDTRKDSDGGAWRKRTQHTSWYNETLNTATRGSRREFPAVAVIVGTSTGIIIYDGDDPDMPMWLISNVNTSIFWEGTISGISALNGKIAVACYPYDLYVVDMIKDNSAEYNNTGSSTRGPLSLRNTSNSTIWATYSDRSILARGITDVTLTLLPNAEVDPDSGLPIPTIIASCRSGYGGSNGVSIIKDNRKVSNITNAIYGSGYWDTPSVFDTKYIVTTASGDYTRVGIADIETATHKFWITSPNIPGQYKVNLGWAQLTSPLKEGFVLGGIYGANFYRDSGICIVKPNIDTPSSSMHCHINATYNSGYQVGDIKGAFLSDTDTTNVTGGGDGLITGSDSTFDDVIANLNWSERSGSGGAWNVSGGVLKTGTVVSGEYLDITTSGYTSGQTYVISYTLANVTGSMPLRWRFNNGQMGDLPTSNGSHSYYVTLTETGTLFSLINDANLTADIDNFKLQLVQEEDRSVNNKGLTAYGTITKSAVATGAELVAYSGNGLTDYLEQPYNSDLNFGANTNFSIMGWMYTPSVGGGQYIFDRSVTYNSSRDWQLWVAADLKYMTMYIAGSQAVLAPNGSFSNNVWFHFAAVRSGGVLKIYINGIEKGSNLSTISTIPTSNVPMKVLYNCNSNTKLALLRFSASAPSPEQIKKIYEDEKVLFQENAACTLYGSSDAVTALAYDDSTNLLYAGTSSGRSDFQGLRRINNTTTAVTTAMSASNGLVAEQ